jgi:hypothetical protein
MPHEVPYKRGGGINMSIREESDSEHSEHQEQYEPPMIDEIGSFTALTLGSSGGSKADGVAYYSR